MKDEPCYHFTVDRKDVYVPVQEAMVEIFKKLHSMLYVPPVVDVCPQPLPACLQW